MCAGELQIVFFLKIYDKDKESTDHGSNRPPYSAPVMNRQKHFTSKFSWRSCIFVF